MVLLHGLGRSARSMARLGNELRSAGYETWSRTYPSRRLPIGELAATVADWIRADLGERPLAAVTHSLGGILVRHMAQELPWRSVVMVAPPNTGSSVARALKDRALFRFLYGPAASDVADGNDWPAPPEPFGVIAGTRGPSMGNPTSWVTGVFSLIEPEGPHDGTVSVAETRLPGMADFTTVDASHTWITHDPATVTKVLSFLGTGRFRVAEAAEAT